MAKVKKAMPAMARAEKREIKMGGHKEPIEQKFISEAHDYDSNRPKKQQRSRYTGSAGAAY